MPSLYMDMDMDMHTCTWTAPPAPRARVLLLACILVSSGTLPCLALPRLCPTPPLQADKLKTFAALNRTQQSAAKKSSEFGAMSPSGAGHHPQGAGGSPGPRGLAKVPSLQKAREVRGGRAGTNGLGVQQCWVVGIK